MRRVRYQFGSLQVVKGAKQDVWTFRFYQPGANGKREYRRIRVGTTEQYPTETAALKALELESGVNFSVSLQIWPKTGICTQNVCSSRSIFRNAARAASALQRSELMNSV